MALFCRGKVLNVGDSLLGGCKELEADDKLLPRAERDSRRSGTEAGLMAGVVLSCLVCCITCISSEANTSLFSSRSTFVPKLFDCSWASFS